MSTALVHAIHSSNMAHHQKSGVMNMIDQIRHRGRYGLAKVGQHGLAAAGVIGDYSLSAASGIGLGLAHVYLEGGLDWKIPGTSGKRFVSLDFAGALLGAGIAIGMPGEVGSRVAGQLGANMGAIFGFRKTYDFFAAKQKKAGKKVGGTFGYEDGDSEWANPTLGAESEEQLLHALKQL
jgi:hypothetical protein